MASYTYTADQNHYLSALDYGNGDKVQYTYDSYGRVVKETFEDGDTVTYQHDNSGALATVTDSATGIKTTYYYDFTDRLLKYSESSSTMSHTVSYQYDDLNNLTALVNTINGSSVTTSFQYDSDNRITASIRGNATKTYTYDAYGRLATRLTEHTSTVTTETFTYKTNASGSPTSQVGSVSIVGGDYSKTYTYTYDANGNITAINDGTYTTTYTYDSANQLISEINPAEGVKRVWTYDDAGNILTRSEYAYTTGTLGTATDTVTYTYSTGGWGDLMTKYDGVKVTTDAIGNTTRFGAATYQWEHGRELASLSQEATVSIVTQPEDFTGILGDAITFSVTARGEDLTYQWQVSTNGTSWYDSGATGNKTAAISGFTITADNDGKFYRCKVTGADGTVRYSEPAQIVLVPIVIDAQPQAFFGAIGDEISFSVTARGESLAYQWQVSTNGGKNWSSSGATGNKTNTISSFDVTDARVGNQYRCKITDSNGNVVYSEPGQIRLDTAIVLKQPEDFYGIVGDRATFTVKAGGSGLTYRWQVSTNGGSTWNNSTAGGYTTASMYVYMTGNNPGYLYRCKITDSYGNVVYSEPGEIKVAADVWEFTYNADGLRTSRTNGYTTYEYVYHGSQLTQMTVGDQVLKFGYDASGAPLYVIWNSSKYFYTTNLQGDVVAIVSANGNPVVYYSYDAWGNILSITGSRADNLGKLNPLRYRGYVYDQETGLYYLQSRYYNPEWGRFLNADSFVSTGQGILGNNMFAYCRNNPVNRKDITGTLDIDCDDEENELSGNDINDWAKGGVAKANASSHHGNGSGTAQTTPNNGAANSQSSDIPSQAWDTLYYLDSHNGHPPNNHKGGKTFNNDGRDNGQRLPDNGISYRKYDIYPKIPYVDRGNERIVVGSDSSAWYTCDHYRSFVRMR